MLVTAGIAAGSTLAVDQVTKAMARSAFEPDETRDLAAGGAIGIGHVENHGSAYGIIPVMPTWAPAVGTAMVGGTLLAVAARHAGGGRASMTTMAAGIGAGLVIGGGLGNVIDRVHQGHVTDMLHTTDLFGYYNVADVAINAGLVAGVGAIMFAR